MKTTTEQIGKEEMRARGEEIARVFQLKKVKGYDPPRFETTHGSKTGQGLYLTSLGFTNGDISNFGD